jgi:hypothetical protein
MEPPDVCGLAARAFHNIGPFRKAAATGNEHIPMPTSRSTAAASSTVAHSPCRASAVFVGRPRTNGRTFRRRWRCAAPTGTVHSARCTAQVDSGGTTADLRHCASAGRVRDDATQVRPGDGLETAIRAVCRLRTPIAAPRRMGNLQRSGMTEVSTARAAPTHLQVDPAPAPTEGKSHNPTTLRSQQRARAAAGDGPHDMICAEAVPK